MSQSEEQSYEPQADNFEAGQDSFQRNLGNEDGNEMGEDGQEQKATGLDDEYGEVTVDSAQLEKLLAAVTFEELDLPEPITKALYEDMHFDRPSKIQAQGLPYILRDPPVDVIAQAQNGSGKTACFAVGFLSRVDISQPAPQVLCIVPTQELATQVYYVVHKLAKRSGITVQLMIPENERVSCGQVIIGTTGSVKSSMMYGKFNPHHIKVFVLDEADEILVNSTSSSDIENVYRFLLEYAQKPQVLLFSATISPETEAACQALTSNPVIIRKSQEELKLDTVTLFHVVANTYAEKLAKLDEMMGLMTIGKSFVFVNSRRCARQLSDDLKRSGHTVGVLYGQDMTPSERRVIMEEFKTGKIHVLVSTNLLARGIDIENATLVVNFDLPESNGIPDYETFLHRVGRTGRMGKYGVGITLIEDYKMSSMKAIEEFYHMEILELDTSDFEASRKVITEALRLKRKEKVFS